MAKVRDASSSKAEVRIRHEGLGLDATDLVGFYKRMLLSRILDERLWTLNRQGKVPIVASAQGHEAAEMGSGLAGIKDGDCFFFPYYRNLSLKVMAGLGPLEAMLSYMGKAGDLYSNGRQFPLQGAALKNKVIQISNVVAAGMTQAVGYALGCRMRGDRTVVLSYFGDGASSEGEAHEAMNFASVHKLPVIFVCLNNRYAISVPQEKQMAILDVADRAAGYGFPGFVVDGMDCFHVYEATTQAITHARSQGPVLLEMKVERYMPHTSDDDDRKYRPEGEVAEARRRDPILSLRSYLVDARILTEQQAEELGSEVKAEVNRATEDGEEAPYPDPSTIYDHLYAP